MPRRPAYGDLIVASGGRPVVCSSVQPGLAAVRLATPACGSDVTLTSVGSSTRDNAGRLSRAEPGGGWPWSREQQRGMPAEGAGQLQKIQPGILASSRPSRTAGDRFLADVPVVDVGRPEAAVAVVARDGEAETPAGGPGTRGGPGLLRLIGIGTSPRRAPRVLAWRLFGFGLALVLVTALSRVFCPWSRAGATIRSLAVLPLKNFSGDASQGYFAGGMTGELITRPVQISTLRAGHRRAAGRGSQTHRLNPGRRDCSATRAAMAA
jgi:hypothetical protein